MLDWLVDRAITPIAVREYCTAGHELLVQSGAGAGIGEAEGLTAAWDDPRVTPVRIPMRGSVDSLNVSVAAAVLLYEAVRQRA